MTFKERLAGAWRHKSTRILLPLPVLMVLALIASGVDYCCYRGKIYPGIYLSGITIGGLRFKEAEARLDAELWSKEKLRLSGKDGEAITVSLSDLGISWERDETMALVRQAGSGLQGYGGRLSRLWSRSPLHLEGIVKVEEDKLKQFVAGLARKVEKKPQNARFTVRGADVVIEKEVDGQYLQAGLLQRRLLDAVRHGQDEVKIPIAVKKPEITAAKLAGYGCDEIMVAFSTEVSSAIPNRVHNISLGAGAINGTLLAPGEIFSFEKVVGEATREKGYREAPVIVGNRLVPGLGGGLCQVSSTLYNAALLANLEIVERYNHSLTIGYLPVGRDASISIGSADLKFKNTRDHHILIGAELKEGRLTCRIFGRPMQERVEIVTTDLVREDPPVHYEKSSALPQGEKELVQRGKAGYHVKTWRVVYRGDEEISRELLSHDYYRPVPTVYRVGTG